MADEELAEGRDRVMSAVDIVRVLAVQLCEEAQDAFYGSAVERPTVPCPICVEAASGLTLGAYGLAGGHT